MGIHSCRHPQHHERAYTTTAGCLTHLTRYISTFRGRETPHAWCNTIPGLGGVSGTGRNRIVWVDPADELFGCHRCIDAAEKHDAPTFSLIPNTGCEATGGERYRPARVVDGAA